jgi:predicted acylesterase/phospholipase RssA
VAPDGTGERVDTPSAGDDELRLALVLNGGVSLAIWMSGVVSEIDALRVTRAPDPKTDPTADVYWVLRKALGLRITVDVIAGTSAGGLNGALLGTAIACGNRFTGVRELWMDSGSLSSLMRTNDMDAVSILIGDGPDAGHPGLLGAVTGALKAASAPGGAEDPGDVRLTMTTSGIHGVAEETLRDSYGDIAERIEHRWRFRFATAQVGNPPLAGKAPISPATISALARAARSSSSFPFAFEPSRIDPHDDAIRQALYTHGGAPVYKDESSPELRGVDGGVLDNSPIDIVLEDIADRPAEDLPVRRAMIFVVPYAGMSVDAPSAEFDLRAVADTTFNLPREVPDLDNLNRVAAYLSEHKGRMRAYDRLMRVPADDLTEFAAAFTPGAGEEAASSAPVTAVEARRVGRRVLSRIRAERARLSPDPADDLWRERLRSLQLAVQVAISKAASDPSSPAVRDPIALAQLHLDQRAAGITPPDPEPPRSEAVWERLLAADRILHSATGLRENDDSNDLGFTFMRLCADAINPGAYGKGAPEGPRPIDPSAKLYGLQLGHFAAFVRSSWRANDWMFGRLDGAARLIDLVLEPRILREQPCTRGQMRLLLEGLGVDREWLKAQVVEALSVNPLPPAAGDDRADERVIEGSTQDQTRVWPGRAATQRSTQASDQISDLPSRELLVWRHAWRITVQTRVIRAELDRVRCAVESDEKLGFHINPRPLPINAADSDEDVLKAFNLYYGEISLKGLIKQLVSDEIAADKGRDLEVKGARQAARMISNPAGGLPRIARHLAPFFERVWEHLRL